MDSVVASSLNLLRLIRQETDAIGVAVSFGKDSICTLDLCCRVFPRVEGFYLFRVRAMDIVEQWRRAAHDRWGVVVRMYPHFDLSRCYRHAVLQPHWRGLDKAPSVKMRDIETKFRADARVDWIAMGWRRSDSFSRCLIMKRCGGYDPAARRVFPLRAWRRADVYNYLASRSIPLPDQFGRKEQAGLDFHPGALSALREDHPADYARWVRDFPFSPTQLLAPEEAEGAPPDPRSA